MKTMIPILAPVTAEERQVADQFGLTESEYRAKREVYRVVHGKSFEEMARLTIEDRSMMASLSIDLNSMQKSKRTGVAKKIINTIGVRDANS